MFVYSKITNQSQNTQISLVLVERFDLYMNNQSQNTQISLVLVERFDLYMKLGTRIESLY